MRTTAWAAIEVANALGNWAPKLDSSLEMDPIGVVTEPTIIKDGSIPLFENDEWIIDILVGIRGHCLVYRVGKKTGKIHQKANRSSLLAVAMDYRNALIEIGEFKK